MKARILVIEDNPDNLELMTYLLKQYNHTTLVAIDGEEGLAITKKETPDLIICDIQLPKLDGFEIVKQLKSDDNLKHIPLIAVTAYSMVGDKDKLLAAGFNGYIAKPIDPKNFVKQVEEFLKSEQRSSLQTISNGHSSKPAEKMIKRPSATQGTILIVDDVIDNAELLSVLLQAFSFKTILATHVNQALKMLEEIKPDLILSDMHIPDRDGLDFLSTVKTNPKLKPVPFIIISSSKPTEEQKRKCLELGAAKIIFRPIDPQVFMQTINEIWGSIKNDTQSIKG